MRALVVAAVCGLLGLAGCAGGAFSGTGGTSGSQQQTGVAGAKLTGAVHGGQNPISGAHVYLLAAASGAGGAGQAAYGGSGIAASASNASVSLLTKGSGQDGSGNWYVTTGGDGSFAISGDYTCAAGQQVYLYALGGDPQMGTGANAAAGLMAALGNCPGTAGSTGNTFSSGTYVIVNEVSTVAAAYAMAGFATDATHVGSSGTTLALTGIANAFANAANLETLGTGVALATTPAGNGTVPQAEINTLANVLAACVNSNGAVTGPTNPTVCYTLFTNTLAGGATGAMPTDTATAAINIAHNPAGGPSGINGLYGLASGTPPFTPGLTAVPNDLTIALGFTGGGLSSGYEIAIDASGDAWITNQGGNSVTELSSSGAPVSGSPYTGGGLNNCAGIAVDRSGNVWVANDPAGAPVTGGNSITELSGSGSFVSGSPYTGGGLNGPYNVAIDGSGDAWITNSGNDSVTEISPGGTFLSGTNGYAGGGLLGVRGIAIDGKGAAWIVNGHSNTVTEISSTGTFLFGTNGLTVGFLSVPFGIGIDAAGNAWVSDLGEGYSDISNSGSTRLTYFSNLGGLFGLAIDGSGDVWVTLDGPLIAEFSNSASPISGRTGYRGGGLTASVSAAVDGSGDVWAVNLGSNMVVEFVGVSTPVITPIAAGLPATPTADGTSNLGTRP
jgi:hypothetical protein